MIKCKTCKDTGFVAQLGYDGEYEQDYCDCTIDPKFNETWELYQLERVEGYIPSDMTYEEWLEIKYGE